LTKEEGRRAVSFFVGAEREGEGLLVGATAQTPLLAAVEEGRAVGGGSPGGIVGEEEEEEEEEDWYGKKGEGDGKEGGAGLLTQEEVRRRSAALPAGVWVGSVCDADCMYVYMCLLLPCDFV
jgi:hypothetical protein